MCWSGKENTTKGCVTKQFSIINAVCKIIGSNKLKEKLFFLNAKEKLFRKCSEKNEQV